MAGQRIGKGGDAARRQAGHFVTVVGAVEAERRGGTDVQQDAAGDDGERGGVERRAQIDERKGCDREGLHRDGVALEDVVRACDPDFARPPAQLGMLFMGFSS